MYAWVMKHHAQIGETCLFVFEFVVAKNSNFKYEKTTKIEASFVNFSMPDSKVFTVFRFS